MSTPLLKLLRNMTPTIRFYQFYGTAGNSSDSLARAKENSTKIEVGVRDQRKEKKKAGTRITQTKELKNFVSGFPFLLATPSFKKQIRINKNPPDILHLVDPSVASTLTQYLVAENLDHRATVIEINPGHGLLTSELISKLGFMKINCFEEDDALAELLASKMKTNVIPHSFVSLPRYHHADQMDGGERVLNVLKLLEKSPEGVGNNKLYIIGSCPAHATVNFALKSLVTRTFIFDESWNWDVTYYLALGSRAATVLTASPDSGYTEYRQTSVNFQLFFKHKVLTTLPRKAYLPWQSTKLNDKSDDSRAQIRHDPEIMQLIKFTPNTEVISKVGPDGLIHLWYFVRHHLYARRSAVIPELEKWIPGCGPRLIRKGYTIYTQFGSLSPEKILELFLDFTSWPEFESCSFISAVDKFLSKTDTADEDV